MFDHTIKELDLDNKYRFLELCNGITESGKAFFAYINILPSKYEEYRRKCDDGARIDLTKLGDILCTGLGKSPSDELKKEMSELYGCDPKFEKNMLDAFSEAENGSLK